MGVLYRLVATHTCLHGGLTGRGLPSVGGNDVAQNGLIDIINGDATALDSSTDSNGTKVRGLQETEEATSM